MKKIILLIFLAGSLTGIAQSKITATDSFIVKGDIKNPVTITLEMIDTFKMQSLNDVVTVNHLGQPLRTLKNAKGVLLKHVLANIQLNASSPKMGFCYYILCVASDGFKVVFSKDEIFNSLNADNTFIVTETDGKKIRDQDDRISIVMLKGNGKGHVYIKGLQQVIFKSVE